MRGLLGLMLVFLYSPDTWAWEHNRFYRECDETIEWWLSDSPDTPEFAVEVISEAFDDWLAFFDCSEGHTFMGVREGHHTGIQRDDFNTFYFGDPANEVTWTSYCENFSDGSIAFSMGGDTYMYNIETDIVFNDGITWLTTDEANDPSCEEGLELKAIALHQIGHMLGLGHSCESGEECSDPLKQEAVMHWSSPEECDASRSVLNADDEEGSRALNGGWVEVNAETDLAGPIPFEFCLSIIWMASSTEPISEIDWGDGSESEIHSVGESICHTYESAGGYTAAVDWQTDISEVINSSTASFQVLACEISELRPEDDIIQIEEISTGSYRLSTETLPFDEGCLNTTKWEVKGSAGVVVDTYDNSPLIRLYPGDYTVTLTMNVAGVDVSTSTDLNVPEAEETPPEATADSTDAIEEKPTEADDKSSSGCTTITSSRTLSFVLILLSWAGISRRVRR